MGCGHLRIVGARVGRTSQVAQVALSDAARPSHARTQNRTYNSILHKKRKKNYTNSMHAWLPAPPSKNLYPFELIWQVCAPPRLIQMTFLSSNTPKHFIFPSNNSTPFLRQFILLSMYVCVHLCHLHGAFGVLPLPLICVVSIILGDTNIDTNSDTT